MDDKLKKINDIIKVVESPFDRALSEILVEYENKRKENEIWKKENLSEINLMVKNYNECKSGAEDQHVDPPSSNPDYIQAYHEYQNLVYIDDILEEEVMALLEMQIIYSYKQVEIALKKFILLFEPTGKDIKTYKWYQLKNKLKSLSVDVEESLGYSSVNELRLVNNSLKHSEKISKDVKKLKKKEFCNSDKFTPQSLALFHSNFIKNKVVFLNSIAHSVGLSLKLPLDDLSWFDTNRVYEEDKPNTPF